MKKKKRKIPQPEPEFLYHFTAAQHYEKILEAGYLKLTPSNLRPPDETTARYITDEKSRTVTYWDKNQDYRPVVWLTSSSDPFYMGLTDIKAQVRITIKRGFWCQRWSEFADKYKMARWWRKALEKGMNAGSWYVSERPIPVSDFVEVCFFSGSVDGANYIKQTQQREAIKTHSTQTTDKKEGP